MKAIVFDSGPIISLAMNNLLWILEPLKKQYGGRFLIPDKVKQEVVDKPLEGKKYKFEALQVLACINKGVLEVVANADIDKKADYLLHVSNSCFKARGNYIKIMHFGEVQALALASYVNAEAFVVDERTTRLIVEKPELLQKILGKKLHTGVEMNSKNILDFNKEAKVNIIRSVELVSIAYKLGLLDKYLPKTKDANKILMDGVLWGVKLNGCSVSNEEIGQLLRMI